MITDEDIVVAYSSELLCEYRTGVSHQQSWGGFCFPYMSVVTAGEASKGALLESNTILRGSILSLPICCSPLGVAGRQEVVWVDLYFFDKQLFFYPW